MHKYIKPMHIGKVVSIVDSFSGLVLLLTLLLLWYLIDYQSMYYGLLMMFVGTIVITNIAFFNGWMSRIGVFN